MSPSAEMSLVTQTIESWQSVDDQPTLDSFLQSIEGGVLRQRADAILVDQSFRLQQGIAVRAEDYLDRCPDIAADTETRMDIVFGEFRHRAGENGLQAQFARRFPDLVDQLQQQWAVSSWLDQGSDPADTIVGLSTSTGAADAPDTFDPAPLNLSDYELADRLGAGAMGSVYRATQRSLNKPVAVKILNRQGGASEELVSRFLREARATAALRHPHIVDVHGVGRCPDGGYFLVMDLIDGVSLHEAVEADGPFDFAPAARAIADIAAAVQHAHQQGVVHRDLKPSNVMVDSDGRVIVVDFGLAKWLQGGSNLSMPGAVIGTPSFMAPEQIESDRGSVSAASDIFALGGLLYYLLTGQPPFPGQTVVQTVANVMADRPVEPPSSYRADTPEPLQNICLQCLHKTPGDRPSSAAEVCDQLTHWLDATPAANAAASGHTAATPSAAATGRPQRWWAASLLLAGLFGAAIAWPLVFPSPVNDPDILTPQRDRLVGGSSDRLPNRAVAPIGETKPRWDLQVLRAVGDRQLEPLSGPLNNGNRLRISVALDAPRYAYVYWVGSDGSVTWLVQDGPPPHPVEQFSLPAATGAVLPVNGPEGTEVCLLLLRDQPLADPGELVDRFKPLQPLPMLAMQGALADGVPLIVPSADSEALLAALQDPSRVLGPAESMYAGAAGKALAEWKHGWPQDLGNLHYLAIPLKASASVPPAGR